MELGIIDRAIVSFAKLALGFTFPARLIGLICLIALLTLFCLWEGKKTLIEKIPSSYWYYIFLSSIFYYLVCNLLVDHITFDSYLNIFLILIMAFSAFCLNIANVFLCRKLVDTYEEKLVLFVSKQRQIADQQAASETERLYQELRNKRHELQNHLFVIQSLAKLNDSDTILSYLAPMCQKQTAREEEFIDTGNLMINAILNPKIALARSYNIPVSVEGDLPMNLPIENQDLCSLISNLLNNAIEACQYTAGSQIMVYLAQKKNYLCIRIKNTVLHDVLKENPDLKTTKPYAEHHGVGTHIVRSIVKKYDGFLDFRMEASFFTAEAFLKLETA